MYKYYAEVELEEHYLYAEEICETLKERFPDITPSVIHSKCSAYYKAYNLPKLFYNRRNGLKRVYPLGLVILLMQKGDK